MRLEHILSRPIALGEKVELLKKNHQFCFEVHRTATKFQIKKAVEAFFNVNVRCVNTMIMRGKTRRMGRKYGKLHNWKKAIVTLKDNQMIDFFSDFFSGMSYGD